MAKKVRGRSDYTTFRGVSRTYGFDLRRGYGFCSAALLWDTPYRLLSRSVTHGDIAAPARSFSAEDKNL